MKTTPLDATISTRHDEAPCLWCQRDGEAVTISFAGGFLTDAVLCMKCLQKALRVRAAQAGHDGAQLSQPAARIGERTAG